MATCGNPEEAKKGITELEKEITCPVCHDHFQDPRILPCCHYYCKHCIQGLVRRTGASQPFPCPECRSDTFLPQNDPDQLPIAFFINRMKELYSKMEKAEGKVEALCEQCSGDKAVAFCRTCVGFICTECVKSHEKLRVFAGHNVATLDEEAYGPTIKQPPPPTCKVHDEQMKVYCYECEQLICRDCVLDDHTGHNYEFVKKAAPPVKQRLAKCLAPLKEAKLTLYNTMTVIKSSKSDVELQGTSAAANIEQSFQELYDLLEGKKHELLDRASHVTQGKLNRLSIQEKGFEDAIAMIQSLVDLVEQNIKKTTEEELMTIHKQMLNRITTETEKHQYSSADLEPVEEADVAMETGCTEELKRLCQEMFRDVGQPIDLSKYTVGGTDIRSAQQNKTCRVNLHAILPNGKPSMKMRAVEAKLTSSLDGSAIEAKVRRKHTSVYEIEYTPRVRGRHLLEITVNGLPVAGSPFPVPVKIPPTHLGKPVGVITRLHGFAVAFNSAGEVVFAEQDGDIVVLDKKGNRLRSIKRSEHGFQTLYGIAIDDSDNIYVTDSGCRSVFKFDSDGTKIGVVRPSMPNFSPRGVAVSSDQVIVSDRKNCKLIFFTRDLELVKTTDFHGRGPVGVACDEDGNVYVCDFDDGCVRVQTVEGKLLYSFSDKGSCKLNKPYSICVDGRLVYVSEWKPGHCVSVFTKEGEFVTSFGGSGTAEGQFNLPSGLAFDGDGALCVSDNANSRLQLF